MSLPAQPPPDKPDAGIIYNFPAERASDQVGTEIIYDLPETDYFALDRLSQSGIKAILKSPAHFKCARAKNTQHMVQGKLIDAVLTTPKGFDDLYYVVPDDFRMDARTTAYKEAKRKAGGRTLVKQRDMDAAVAIRDVLEQHSTVSALINDAIPQPVALWEEPTEQSRIPMKARLDWMSPEYKVLIDLKTTEDAQAFSRTAARLGYHIQDACYTHSWQQAGGFVPDAFIFIVVEREPPYGIRVLELSERAKELGLQRYRRGVEQYAACLKRNQWNAYSTDIETIDLPNYIYHHHEEI